MADTRLEPVALSRDERRTLENWVRRRSTAQGLAQRARIAPARPDGGNNAAVAARLRIDGRTVARWRPVPTGTAGRAGRRPAARVPCSITDARVKDVPVKDS
jgi:hypothetical protein